MNVASLASYIPGLEFDNNMISHCKYESPDGRIFFFHIDENEESDPYAYLKKSGNDNPLFKLVYSPSEKKFYSIDDFYQTRNLFFSQNIKNISSEDLFDISIIYSESDLEVPEQIEPEPDCTPHFPSLKPFIETALTSKNPYKALIFLNSAGILEKVFPFLSKMKGINQDRSLHPEGDVFEHTLHCFQFVKSPSLRLVYGLLLHDIGKTVPTKRKGFYGHSTLGARFIEKILSDYGYDLNFINDIQFLVQYHMVNSYFFRLTDKERKNIFDNGLGVELLKLYKADTMGSIGKLDIYQDIISVLKRDKSIKSIK